ncbi:MAG: LytTR family DNA-binding domain-containing protein, partial [Pseudomonadota bacterium]
VAVKSTGKIDRVSSDQIVQVKGAGSFVEIMTTDGRKLLHADQLSGMESILPSTFIRVHRSHLVNTRFVKSLRRSPQGNGTLVLSDESEVPVSRRIMPSVRKAIA